MVSSISGIGIGIGVVVAKVYLLPKIVFNFDVKSNNSAEVEAKNLLEVLQKTEIQIDSLINIAEKNISAEKADIFRAHKMMSQDAEIISEIKGLIEQGISLASSISQIYDKHIDVFLKMEDKYFKERAADLQDIKKRLLSNALNIELPDLLLINEECIIVANDLTPSETVLLNPKFVKGFITDIGGSTSHSAIMAKTMGIPAIVSTKNATSVLKQNNLIAIDASAGIVEFELDKERIKYWDNKKTQHQKLLEELKTYKKKSAITLDKVSINVYGNIGSPKDLAKVIENGGQGVGLFRSEFLYMDSPQWPTYEEQFNAYKQVLSEIPKNSPITIRTLDIGGDKHLDYYQFPEEMNPFLGYRALRMSLVEIDIFKTQLRALLAASVYGKLKIMFPMVTTTEEFIKAKEITLEVVKELKEKNIPVSDDLQIGMMIEIPSSALMADKFAEIVDFFSIGSNDLIQYTHAVDRMSKEVNYLYQPNSPSILKLIQMSVKAALKKKIGISVCGEMASSPSSVPILLGLGVDTLSMSANSIPMIKRIINNVTLSSCKTLANKALKANNEEEVKILVKEFFAKHKLYI